MCVHIGGGDTRRDSSASSTASSKDNAIQGEMTDTSLNEKREEKNIPGIVFL